MDILVKTLAGLESVLADELRQLGGSDLQPLNRAVQCKGDQRLLYRINLEARTALRALMPIHHFQARNEDQLYRGIQQVNWTDYMGLSNTLAVDAVVHSSFFNHSKYVALKSKDAIVDQFRDRTGRRPNVDVETPDLLINVHIREAEVSVALDSSADSLHKRGYRQMTVEAPMNEVLAAGILQMTGWDRQQAFVDPMCGSGTLPIEAAMLAMHIPPQWTRTTFGFMRWRNFDRRLWQDVRQRARYRIRTECPAPIFASDKDMQAIRAVRRNASLVGVEGAIQARRRPFERLQAPAPQGVLVMNPPYDERLQVEQIETFYRQIGDHLKQEFSGYTAWILSAHTRALKQVGLRAHTRHQLFNGALPSTLVAFDLYQGSRAEETA